MGTPDNNALRLARRVAVIRAQGGTISWVPCAPGSVRDCVGSLDALTTRDESLARLKTREQVMTDIRSRSRRPRYVRHEVDAMVRSRNATAGAEHVRDVTALSADQARDCALRMLDDPKTIAPLRGSTRALDELECVIRDDDDVARRMVVTETAAYRSMFMRYLREGIAGTFSAEETDAARRYTTYERAQSETTTAGGFAVPPTVDPSIIVTDAGSPNPYLRLCTVKDVDTNTWKGIAGAAAAWSSDAENTEVSDDANTSMTGPSIPTFTARAWIQYSIELGEDWPDFAANISAMLALGYDEYLVDKFSRGVGTTEPTGILTALAAASPTVIVTSSTDGVFSDVDINNCWNALPAKYRANATWMASTTVASEIRLASALYHASAVTLDGNIAASEILMGRQFVEMPFFPAASSTTGANTRLVVGDFSQMNVIRRRGITVETVPLAFSPTDMRPSGQRGLFASARIGSDVPNPNAFRYQANT